MTDLEKLPIGAIIQRDSAIYAKTEIASHDFPWLDLKTGRYYSHYEVAESEILFEGFVEEPPLGSVVVDKNNYKYFRTTDGWYDVVGYNYKYDELRKMGVTH